jgi:sugar phosphate permease
MNRASEEVANTPLRRWMIFSVATFSFFLSQFYRATNAVIAPQLIQDLSLTTEQLGLLSAAFFYAFAATQIPIGLFLDRVGPRRLMTGLSLIGVVGAVVFSISDSMGMGLLGRVLLGVGMSCNLMGTFKLITGWFSPKVFATLAGVIFSIGTVGNMAATTPLVFLVGELGWRTAFQLVAGINLLLILLFWYVVRDRPVDAREGGSAEGSQNGLSETLSGLRLLFRRREFWIISFGTFVSYGIFSSLQTLWAGPYLIEAMGFSAVAAGNVIFFLNIGVIISGPVVGVFSDKILKSRKWVIFPGHLVLSLLMLLIIAMPPGSPLLYFVVLFTLFGLFRGTGQLMYPHIKDVMPVGMAGTAMTGVNFFTMIGSALFLHGLGALMQLFYPDASRGIDAFHGAFLLCAAFLACVSLSYLFTREPNRTPYQSEGGL